MVSYAEVPPVSTAPTVMPQRSSSAAIVRGNSATPVVAALGPHDLRDAHLPSLGRVPTEFGTHASSRRLACIHPIPRDAAADRPAA